MKLSPRTKRNLAWIEAHLRVPEGRLVGQPVKFSPAQREWLEMIYGSPTRTFICSLPRKNGKTSFSAMLLLLHLVGVCAAPRRARAKAEQSAGSARRARSRTQAFSCARRTRSALALGTSTVPVVQPWACLRMRPSMANR